MEKYPGHFKLLKWIAIHGLKSAHEKAIGHPTRDSMVYNLLHRHG